MANFAELMKGKIEDLMKAPPALPIGDYPGVVRKFEFRSFEGTDKTTGEKKTFHKLALTVGLLGWPDSFDPEQIAESRVENITQRITVKEFFLPPGRDFAKLCQECGITGEVDERTPGLLVGQHVLACVKHRADRKTGEIFAFADSLIGAGA